MAILNQQIVPSASPSPEVFMKIIVTGFAPFGGDVINPSYEAVKLLPDTLDGCELIKLEMPVSYEACRTILEWMIPLYCPDCVVCLGQAKGRTAITPEYVAINLKHSTAPDNSDVVYLDAPVIPDGPAAYFTTLPVREMVTDLQNADLPGFVSYSAGTYVCNCLMYQLMNLLNTHYPSIKGGFIHVPYSKEQAEGESLPLYSMEISDIARGIEICLRTLISSVRSGQ